MGSGGRGRVCMGQLMVQWTSLALLTLYPKSEGRRVWSLQVRGVVHCDQKLVYPIRMRFQLLTS